MAAQPISAMTAGTAKMSSTSPTGQSVIDVARAITLESGSEMLRENQAAAEPDSANTMDSAAATAAR